MVDTEDVLQIERIISGGDGMARGGDGCVVFVPRTAPGERVRVRYTQVRKQWRRASVLAVEVESPDRQAPPCRHYEHCGGCQLQHLQYDAQLRAKASIINDCMQRIGRVQTPVVSVDASPRQWQYRNRVAFVVRGEGNEFAAGFHEWRDPDRIVDVDACPLAEDAINGVWQALRKTLHATSRKTPLDLRVTIRSAETGKTAVVIESRHNSISELTESILGIDNVVAVWWVDARGKITAGAGDENLAERRGDYEVSLAGNAFLQVNRSAARMLDEYVIGECAGAVGRHIIDAYCGFGLRSLDLARSGAVVTGVDLDEHSIATANRLSTTTGIAAAFVTAPVERALPGRLPADIVVMNPPRRGVDGKALQALVGMPPERVIYVSCNPATLARDLKALAPAFEVAACRAFDLFPQTAHVETVVSLSRRQ